MLLLRISKFNALYFLTLLFTLHKLSKHHDNCSKDCPHDADSFELSSKDRFLKFFYPHFFFWPCQLSLCLRKKVKKVGKYFVEIKEKRSRKSKRPFCAFFSCVPLNQRMGSKETFWLSVFEKCKKCKTLYGT